MGSNAISFFFFFLFVFFFSGGNLKTQKLLDRALIGVCAVITSSMAFIITKSEKSAIEYISEMHRFRSTCACACSNQRLLVSVASFLLCQMILLAGRKETD